MAKQIKRNDPVSAILVLAGAPDTENIWVRKLKKDHYEVLTIPFWGYNLSLGDTVKCGPDEDGVGLFVESIIRKSGNRTIRIAFLQKGQYLKHPEGVKLIEYLTEQNLRYEVFPPSMLAVNIPPTFDYNEIVDRLAAIPAEAQMQWEDGDPQPTRNLDGSEVC